MIASCTGAIKTMLQVFGGILMACALFAVFMAVVVIVVDWMTK